MWAPDCAYANGKYYFYFPHPRDPSDANWNNTWKIGVATSSKPAATTVGGRRRGPEPGLGNTSGTKFRPQIYTGAGKGFQTSDAGPRRARIAPGPLRVLRTTDELPETPGVLSGGLSYLAEVAQSTHSWKRDDVGEICSNPPATPAVATPDLSFLDWSRESRLRNPLR